MGVEEGIDEYTQDGTVDLKGNPVLRSKRGGWTACWFVVGNFSLSLSLFSISLSKTLIQPWISLLPTNQITIHSPCTPFRTHEYYSLKLGTQFTTPLNFYVIKLVSCNLLLTFPYLPRTLVCAMAP